MVALLAHMPATSATSRRRKAKGIVDPPKDPVKQISGRLGQSVRQGKNPNIALPAIRSAYAAKAANHQAAVVSMIRGKAEEIAPDAIEYLGRLVRGEGDCERAPHAVRVQAAAKVIELVGFDAASENRKDGKSLNEMGLEELSAFIHGGVEALDRLQFQQSVPAVEGERVMDGQASGDNALIEQDGQPDQQSDTQRTRRSTVGLE